MKARKKGFVIPARTEILGGGFVLILLATISLVRGGPQITRAEFGKPQRTVAPAGFHSQSQNADHARLSNRSIARDGKNTATTQPAAGNTTFAPRELPGKLPPKPLADS